MVPGHVTALPNQETIRWFYSDPGFTNAIGYTDVMCRGGIRRSGIYEGGPGWEAYVAQHHVYSYFDYGPCDEVLGSNPTCARWTATPLCWPNADGSWTCTYQISSTPVNCPASLFF
ncbi:MAG TPA: hypothetical protein VGG91_03665 [Myxococcaceae bacterium]